MFWRGFLKCYPRMTITTASAIGRKKILPQNPLSSFFESLNFAFQGVRYGTATGIYGLCLSDTTCTLTISTAWSPGPRSLLSRRCDMGTIRPLVSSAILALVGSVLLPLLSLAELSSSAHDASAGEPINKK